MDEYRGKNRILVEAFRRWIQEIKDGDNKRHSYFKVLRWVLSRDELITIHFNFQSIRGCGERIEERIRRCLGQFKDPKEEENLVPFSESEMMDQPSPFAVPPPVEHAIFDEKVGLLRKVYFERIKKKLTFRLDMEIWILKVLIKNKCIKDKKAMRKEDIEGQIPPLVLSNCSVGVDDGIRKLMYVKLIWPKFLNMRFSFCIKDKSALDAAKEIIKYRNGLPLSHAIFRGEDSEEEANTLNRNNRVQTKKKTKKKRRKKKKKHMSTPYQSQPLQQQQYSPITPYLPRDEDLDDDEDEIENDQYPEQIITYPGLQSPNTKKSSSANRFQNDASPVTPFLNAKKRLNRTPLKVRPPPPPQSQQKENSGRAAKIPSPNVHSRNIKYSSSQENHNNVNNNNNRNEKLTGKKRKYEQIRNGEDEEEFKIVEIHEPPKKKRKVKYFEYEVLSCYYLSCFHSQTNNLNESAQKNEFGKTWYRFRLQLGLKSINERKEEEIEMLDCSALSQESFPPTIIIDEECFRKKGRSVCLFGYVSQEIAGETSSILEQQLSWIFQELRYTFQEYDSTPSTTKTPDFDEVFIALTPGTVRRAGPSQEIFDVPDDDQPNQVDDEDEDEDEINSFPNNTEIQDDDDDDSFEFGSTGSSFENPFVIGED